jgi:GNAT superfamily N-acetyltransferase
MRLDYLTLNDKHEYLRLMDCLVDSQINDEVWNNFFQTYDESLNKVIYMARMTDKSGQEITVGTATTVIDYKIYLPGPIVQLEDVVVFPKYRLLGFGRKIIEAIEKDAETYNPSIITVSCGNEEVVEFFLKVLLKNKPNSSVGITISKWM